MTFNLRTIYFTYEPMSCLEFVPELVAYSDVVFVTYHPRDYVRNSGWSQRCCGKPFRK